MCMSMACLDLHDTTMSVNGERAVCVLQGLINFDKDNLPEACCAAVEKEFLSNPNFNADYIRNKSGAAAGLCGWVVNICKYFRIYQVKTTHEDSSSTPPCRTYGSSSLEACGLGFAGRLICVVACEAKRTGTLY